MKKMEKLQLDFINNVQGLITEFEKQKLPLKGRLCLWMLKQKMRLL